MCKLKIRKAKTPKRFQVTSDAKTNPGNSVRARKQEENGGWSKSVNSPRAESHIMENTGNTFLSSPFKKGLASEINFEQWEQRWSWARTG